MRQTLMEQRNKENKWLVRCLFIFTGYRSQSWWLDFRVIKKKSWSWSLGRSIPSPAKHTHCCKNKRKAQLDRSHPVQTQASWWMNPKPRTAVQLQRGSGNYMCPRLKPSEEIDVLFWFRRVTWTSLCHGWVKPLKWDLLTWILPLTMKLIRNAIANMIIDVHMHTAGIKEYRWTDPQGVSYTLMDNGYMMTTLKPNEVMLID